MQGFDANPGVGAEEFDAFIALEATKWAKSSRAPASRRPEEFQLQREVRELAWESLPRAVMEAYSPELLPGAVPCTRRAPSKRRAQ